MKKKYPTNYRKTAFEAYPHYCAVCGWRYDERVLEVHHRDSNHSNNNPANLVLLCPTCHRMVTLKYYALIGNRLFRIK